MTDKIYFPGYYLYAEASNRQASDRAIISYPTSSLEQQTACMSFWYHMFGQHVGTLKVTEVKEGGQVNTLWEHSGDQGGKVEVWSDVITFVKSVTFSELFLHV